MKILQEAFQSGTAGKVIGKFVRILGKRLGKNLMTSPIAYDNKTAEGMFKSFYCMFPDGKRAIRFNFLLKNSDILHSVDIFKGPSRIPDYKVYLDGLNSLQALSTIEAAIRGHITDLNYESIQEARNIEHEELYAAWIEQPGIKERIEREKFSNLVRDFEAYAAQNGVTQIANVYQRLNNYIKNYIKMNPDVIPRNIPVARVDSQVSIDKPLVTQSASQEWSEIQNEADDHLQKYRMLEYYTQLLASKNSPRAINGLFIAGKAGVGKTSSLLPILDGLGANYIVYKGKVAGPSALYDILWQHTANDPKEIIIFDDCDAMLAIPDAVNILKGAMENSDVREITYGRKQKLPPTITKDESIREAEEKPVSLADFGQADVTVIADQLPAPDRFNVGPKIIFISNLKSVPEAIGSRCLRIVFNFTEEQIWELIDDNIENIINPGNRAQKWQNIPGINFREINKEAVMEVLDFCRKLKVNVDVVDFRQINFALCIYAGCTDGSWRKWLRMHFRRI